MTNKLILSVVLFLSVTSFSKAEEYVVIAQKTNIFDTPIAKSEYFTKNQDDDDVILFPGMAFKLLERKNGWATIEYSDGLRALIMEVLLYPSKKLKVPEAGKYIVTNNPSETVTAIQNNDNWTLRTPQRLLNGKVNGNIIIFADGEYILTNISGNNKIYNYNNKITKYF